MKKITISSLAIIISLFFVGCANNQPSKSIQYKDYFNPNNTRVVFVKGKPYNIPISAIHSTIVLNSAGAKKFNRLGAICNPGDILWTYKYDNAKAKIDIEAYFRLLIQRGYMQCAHPLNTQEYQYSLHKDKQREKALRTIAGYDTPKINVEHSGSINIYHY
jgi:hypothetical protein